MTERKFSKEVGEWIALQFIQDWATSETDGIRVKKSMEANDCTQVLSWTPACEMDGWPNSPDALTYPSLPYPFTAKELAAFLLAGTGSMVAEYYGDFSDGPDEDRLQALGIKAGHAKEALRQAYTEIRRAIAEVGEVDQELQQKAHTLRHQFHDANLEANNKENIWEPGISNDECQVRRERARQSLKALEEETDSVGRNADADLKRWNAAMIKALLYPAPVVTDAALPVDVPEIARPEPAAPLEAVVDSTIAEDPPPEPPPVDVSEEVQQARVTPLEAAAGVEVNAGLMPAWAVFKPQRFVAYSLPLWKFLTAAHCENKSLPTARDVVEAWRSEKPAEIAKMLPDGFDYYDAKGNTKSADLEAIRKAIGRMTTAR